MAKRVRLSRSKAASNGKGKPVNGSTLPTEDDQLVKVTIPISFGTSLADMLGDISTKKKEMTVKQFFEEWAKNIDVRPPYQRDDAWKLSQQAAFIQSVFNEGIELPPMYLCKKTKRDNCVCYWALDCRQRDTALLNFFANKFKITTYHHWSSGAITSKLASWSEISKEPEYKARKMDFTNRKLTLNVIEYLPLSDQRIMFEALNNGTPLNMDEITYCKNFLARKVLDTLYPQVFGSVSKFLGGAVEKKQRFAHIRTMHELLILVGGELWSEKTVEARALRQTERLRSAKSIHAKLEGMGFEYEQDLTADHRRTLGLHGLSQMAEIANMLAGIYEENPTLGREEITAKTLNGRKVIDPLAFLYGKVQDNSTSVQELRSNLPKLLKFLKEFYSGRTETSLNTSTSDLKCMTAKFKLLEDLFKKYKLARSAAA